MPIIASIPDRYKEGFRKMSSLDSKTFEAIQEGLSYTSLTVSISSLSEKIASLKNLSLPEIKEIFFSVGSLSSLIDKENAIEEIVDDICTSAIRENLIEKTNVDNFKFRLSFLLNNQQIYYASKGNRLMTEYGNVYLQSRIITDIRPIFSSNPDEIPKAGVIVHNLHLHYRSHNEENHKDFFIALDSADIKLLKEDIIKAEKKEKSLQLLYDKIGMTNLNE